MGASFTETTPSSSLSIKSDRRLGGFPIPRDQSSSLTLSSSLTSVAFMCRVANSRIILTATLVLLYFGASNALRRGTTYFLLTGCVLDDIRRHFNRSFWLLHCLCFGLDLTLLFVRMITHVGTDLFFLPAFTNLFFLDVFFLLPMIQRPLNSPYLKLPVLLLSHRT